MSGKSLYKAFTATQIPIIVVTLKESRSQKKLETIFLVNRASNPDFQSALNLKANQIFESGLTVG